MNPAADEGDSQAQSRARIAIVGMSCLFPGAPNLVRFWANLINGVSSIREAGPLEWDAARYFDPSRRGFGKTYCNRAGFISEHARFDPLRYAVMPNSVQGSDPDQLLALRLGSDAMADAGIERGSFNAEKASVILGRTAAPGVGAMNLIQKAQTVPQMLDALAAARPDLSEADLESIEGALTNGLRQCNSDTIPGVMPNIIAGRLATKLGFQGRNYILDAACSSSLLAVELAVRELLSGEADLVLAGGIHVNSCAYFFQMFAGIGALSPSGEIRPFDDGADGTLLGEGAGLIVLRRLEDALAAGNRVYATIAGTGSSSDGSGTSVLAPSVDGEALAIKRALDMSGLRPEQIGLLEAHGTGTAAGDAAELKAIENAWAGATAGGASGWCALGSVKSNIGHAQAASGIAGLIKAALALYQKAIPPTLNAGTASRKVDWSTHPCYLAVKARPWIHPEEIGARTTPRRAAVSAFGFGGVNSHVILEEALFADEDQQRSFAEDFDSELFVIQEESREALAESAGQLARWLTHNPHAALKDVAYTINCCRRRILPASGHRAAIVARTVADAGRKLFSFVEWLGGAQHSPLGSGTGRLMPEGQESLSVLDGHLTGVYYRGPGGAVAGKTAFVFPGLGCAYPGMLEDLCYHFPGVRAVFDYVDYLAGQIGEKEPPSRKIFPPGVEDNETSLMALARSDAAVVTVLLAEYALCELLRKLKIVPDAFAGCSTGEFAAITMSGSVDVLSAAAHFYKMSVEVARSLPEERLRELTSIRVFADYERLEPLLKGLAEPIYLSGYLAPEHVILTGARPVAARACAVLKQSGIAFHELPFAIPYHTRLVEDSVDTGRTEFRQLEFLRPDREAWSCSLASPLPADPAAIRQIAVELFARPVRLRETIERMYADGFRTFVEVGPRGSMTGLISSTLTGRPHIAVAANLPNRASITQIHHLLGALWVNAVEMDLQCLYQRRSPVVLDFSINTHPADEPLLDLTYPELTVPPHLLKPFSTSLDQQPASVFVSNSDRAGSVSERSPESCDGVHATHGGVHATHGGGPGSVSEKFPESCDGINATHDGVHATHGGGPGSVSERFPESCDGINATHGGGPGSVSERFPESCDGVHATHDGVHGTHGGGPGSVSERFPESCDGVHATHGGSPGSTGFQPASTSSSACEKEPERRLSQAFSTGTVSDITPGAVWGSESTRSTPGPDAVMESYLLSTAAFHNQLMETHSAVLAAYLQGTETIRETVPALPFLRGGIQRLSAEEAVVHYILTLQEDLFLIDHAIGGYVRQTGAVAERVYLLPLMVALEMMAEAATTVAEGMAVIRLENVRAAERIRVPAEGFPCILRARRVSFDRVQVELMRGDGGQSGRDAAREPEQCMSCEVVLGSALPPSPPPASWNEAGVRAPHLAPEALYGAGAMFHGPRMQAVQSLSSVSERCTSGLIHNRASGDWFASLAQPYMLVNPLLLDNASQLVLFHLFEQQLPVVALLPFYIESVEIFAPVRSAAAEPLLKGRALLHSAGERGTRATVEASTRGGEVVVRLNGINSRRIALPERWMEFVHDPSFSRLCRTVELPVHRLGIDRASRVACFDIRLLPEDSVVLEWLADYILSEAERRLWKVTCRDENRKRQWLAGRIAAKHAVAQALAPDNASRLLSHDIEILYGQAGQPEVGDSLLKLCARKPSVSISHSDVLACAWAAWHPAAGIDVVPINRREEGFTALAFTEEEQRFLVEPGALQEHEAAAHLWAAREAVAKALGTGFQNGFKHGFIVQSWDRGDSASAIGSITVSARASGMEISLPVITCRLEEHVLALAASPSGQFAEVHAQVTA